MTDAAELPPDVVWRGNPQLIPLLVPLDSLTLDPENARDHTGPRSLEVLSHSLEDFGQQKPAVVREAVVKAGNGLVMAARALGWTHFAVLDSDLDADAIEAFAIVDNRSPELSVWDDGALAQKLEALREQGMDPLRLGFAFDEIESLTTGGVLELEKDADAPVGGLASTPQVRGEDATITITVRRGRVNDPALKRDLEAFAVKHGLAYRIRV